jgi:two-component system sensor kinase FixL
MVCLIVLGWQAGRAAGSKREAPMEIAGGDARADDTAGLARQLRASEARWRAIVESAVDGIVVIDADGRIEAFNPAAERLFGYSDSELIGLNVTTLMPSPYREEHDGYLSRYLATGQARIIGTGREVVAQRRDGSSFPVQLSVGEITIGGERKFTGILHDLTSRVRIETALREQTALARLGEMAAVIAHEVRNPLAGIRGAVQVFVQRSTLGEAEAPVLKEVLSRIDALDALVGDLLLFARAPQPHLAPVDIGPLVALTGELLRRDPAMRQLELAIQGACPPIEADAELLKIVFHNLLLNAAQAVDGDGVVQVHIRDADGACQVEIRDRGPGIPPDVRDRMFLPFVTTKARGSGLGLATSKRLVEAHHGDITVDFPPDGGTIMTVRIPGRIPPRRDT